MYCFETLPAGVVVVRSRPTRHVARARGGRRRPATATRRTRPSARFPSPIAATHRAPRPQGDPARPMRFAFADPPYTRQGPTSTPSAKRSTTPSSSPASSASSPTGGRSSPPRPPAAGPRSVPARGRRASPRRAEGRALQRIVCTKLLRAASSSCSPVSRCASSGSGPGLPLTAPTLPSSTPRG